MSQTPGSRVHPVFESLVRDQNKKDLQLNLLHTNFTFNPPPLPFQVSESNNASTLFAFSDNKSAASSISIFGIKSPTYSASNPKNSHKFSYDRASGHKHNGLQSYSQTPGGSGLGPALFSSYSTYSPYSSYAPGSGPPSMHSNTKSVIRWMAKRLCLLLTLGLVFFLTYTLINIDTDALIESFLFSEDYDQPINQQPRPKKHKSKKGPLHDTVELAVVGCKGPHKDSVGKYSYTHFFLRNSSIFH